MITYAGNFMDAGNLLALTFWNKWQLKRLPMYNNFIGYHLIPGQMIIEGHEEVSKPGNE